MKEIMELYKICTIRKNSFYTEDYVIVVEDVRRVTWREHKRQKEVVWRDFALTSSAMTI